MELMPTKPKLVLITGASRGIGRACAEAAARAGYAVAITFAQRASAAEAVVAAINAEGGKATAYAARWTSSPSP